MTTSKREQLFIGLAKAVTGLATLDRDQKKALAALASSLPEQCTLGDVIESIKNGAGGTLAPVMQELEPLTRSGATAHLLSKPLEREVIQEVEIEAMLAHLEQRVAFDLECLDRGIDPRSKGLA